MDWVVGCWVEVGIVWCARPSGVVAALDRSGREVCMKENLALPLEGFNVGVSFADHEIDPLVRVDTTLMLL